MRDSGPLLQSAKPDFSSSPTRLSSERRCSLLRRHAPSCASTGAGERRRAPQSVATLPFKVDELRGITTAAADAAVRGAVSAVAGAAADAAVPGAVCAVACAAAGITSSARSVPRVVPPHRASAPVLCLFRLTAQPVTTCWTRLGRLIYPRSTFYNRRGPSFGDRSTKPSHPPNTHYLTAWSAELAHAAVLLLLLAWTRATIGRENTTLPVLAIPR